MDIKRHIKNLIVINPVVAPMFSAFRETWLYRQIVHFAARRAIKHLTTSKEYLIQIETTNICNAKCGFCPYTVMQRSKSIMSDAIFNTLVRKIKEEGIKPYGFNVNGTGEPLIDKQIFARIFRLHREFPKAVLKFHSNFNLATPELIDDLLDSGLTEINISLNGYSQAVYEDVMKIKYDRTVANIHLLLEKRAARKSPLIVRISMVLVAANETHESWFLDYWTPRVDSVSINRPHDYSRKAKDMGGRNHVRYDTQHLPCKSLWSTITIGVNGDLLLCCLDHEGDLNLGNVMDHGILELYNSETFNKYRSAHMTGNLDALPMCDNCGVPHESGATWFLKNLI